MVLPGEVIQTEAKSVGRGIYVHQGQLRASLQGEVVQTGDQVEVRGVHESGAIPQPGQWVIGTISRINTRQATMDIKFLLFDQHQSVYLGQHAFRGTIRQADILSPEQRVKHPAYPVHWAFRPGDQVKAKVLGAGEASVGYLLSTGEESAGVIYAKAVGTGEPMVPVAWDEMLCERSGQREKRKCAKPDNHSN